MNQKFTYILIFFFILLSFSAPFIDDEIIKEDLQKETAENKHLTQLLIASNDSIIIAKQNAINILKMEIEHYKAINEQDKLILKKIEIK